MSQKFKYKYKLKEESTTSSNSGFISGTEGENYASPKAFKKKLKEGPGANLGPGPSASKEGVKNNIYVTKFKYKLVNRPELTKQARGVEYKKLFESDTNVEQYIKDLNIENNPDLQKFITSRILGFDELEKQLNQLLPLLQKAKHETMDFYKQNPNFNVLYGTDLANDYLKDLIELFNE